ncbi:MAG: cytochrome c biogenesis protein CcsA [Planctomycetes bacterium]|nr:cytochrome c biogenesis protein CcsA [Planctomycetota bacterium]
MLAVIQVFFFFILTSPTDAEAAQRSSPFSLAWHWLVGATRDDAGKVLVQHAHLTVAQALETAGMKASPEGWQLLRAMVEGGKGSLTLSQVHALVLSDASSLPLPAQQVLLDQVSDGNGMNPALHNYWIAIHPPMLYLGFVGLTIPFAYAVGSLLAGEVGESWLRPIRLWTMASWGFLTVGIALGGLWAYEILGWGGYWAWDPVENASFIPWLTGTAFIHSVIVTERRGMLRVWAFALVIITYCMTVIGTFLVRSGIINSVHAFGATGDVDVWFYGFLGVVLVGSLLVLAWRLPLLAPDRKLDSPFSREFSFLLNNLVLLAIALATLVITFWPWITKQLYGESGSEELGADVFVMINTPLFLLLLLLMGIGPALAWRDNSGRQMLRTFAAPAAVGVVVGAVNLWRLSSAGLLIETGGGDAIANSAAVVRLAVQVTLWPICAFTLVCIAMEFLAGARARARSTKEGLLRAMAGVTLANRRRYGGYIVHLGVLLVALGIYYSSFYESEGTVVAPPGGFAVLQDRLSSRRMLVLYESSSRSDGWDMVQQSFRRDPQTAQLYERLLQLVRANPDKDAGGILQLAVGDAMAELPPPVAARLAAAASWAVGQRDNKRVYEEFSTRLVVVPYEAPADLDPAPYLKAHSAAQAHLASPPAGRQDAASAGRVLARMLLLPAVDEGAGFRPALDASMAEYAATADSDFASWSGLASLMPDLSAAQIRAAREALEGAMAAFEADFGALALEGVKLGAELPEVNRGVRDQAAALPAAQFAELFGLEGDSAAQASRRFEALQRLEKFHAALEAETARKRGSLVRALVSRLPDAEAEKSLHALRPLSLAGLVAAREGTAPGKQAWIDAETAEIRRDALELTPRLRLFYDKRTGAPRMNEAVKDPFIHRTLSTDVYFILQDTTGDGTATLRFFLKPQMALGLAGLGVLMLGTLLAFLPTMRRRSAA